MKYKNSSGLGAPVYGRCCAKSGSHVSDGSPPGVHDIVLTRERLLGGAEQEE